MTPRNSGGGQPAYHPSQGVVSPNNPSAVQNYGVISTEVTPQATPIAAKKLTSGSSGGSSACFSNYMPMSECSSQNTNDSGRGTHEQMTLPPGNNAADASLESSFFEVGFCIFTLASFDRKRLLCVVKLKVSLFVDLFNKPCSWMRLPYLKT